MTYFMLTKNKPKICPKKVKVKAKRSKMENKKSNRVGSKKISKNDLLYANQEQTKNLPRKSKGQSQKIQNEK